MTRNRNPQPNPNASNKSLVISSGVTSDWIKSFYENYDCSKHRAACAACQKRELFDGEEFLGCSGCQVSVYCSRECQKAHWKRHKEFCKMNSCTEDSAHFKMTLRKMKKFKGMYYPLIELMIHLRFALLAKELDVDLDSIPGTHTMHLVLADIPDDMVDAKKPRIIIKNLEPVPIAALSEKARKEFIEKCDRLLKEGHVVNYSFVYPCFDAGKCYSWSQSCLHSRDPFFYFRRYDKLEMLEKILWLTQGINGMAKGIRPDLYKEVKRFLKEDGGRHMKGADDDKNSSEGGGGGRSNKKKNRGRNRKTG